MNKKAVKLIIQITLGFLVIYASYELIKLVDLPVGKVEARYISSGTDTLYIYKEYWGLNKQRKIGISKFKLKDESSIPDSIVVINGNKIFVIDTVSGFNIFTDDARAKQISLFDDSATSVKLFIKSNPELLKIQGNENILKIE